MGFFKKIGKAIKKGVKQISFKNLVKVGSMVDPTGIVGGLQDAHYAKKEAKAMEQANNQAMAEYYNQQANQYATGAGVKLANTLANTSVGQSTLNGFVGATGANVADSSIKVWFQRHWQKVAIGGGLLVGVILLLRRGRGSKKW